MGGPPKLTPNASSCSSSPTGPRAVYGESEIGSAVAQENTWVNSQILIILIAGGTIMAALTLAI